MGESLGVEVRQSTGRPPLQGSGDRHLKRFVPDGPRKRLSKKPDMKVRRYENGPNWAEVRPGSKSLATVFDRDVLIYCISQLVAATNDGRKISKTLRLRAYALLIATNRDSSGRGHLKLREAFERLQGTQIVTNIVTGGKEAFDVSA